MKEKERFLKRINNQKNLLEAIVKPTNEINKLNFNVYIEPVKMKTITFDNNELLLDLFNLSKN